MDLFGRYYTLDRFSDLLVSEIPDNKPNWIVDLGSGNHSLTNSASVRWSSAHFASVDVEEGAHPLTSNVTFVKGDMLNRNDQDTLFEKVGEVDLAICNPPYIPVPNSSDLRLLLQRAGMHKSVGLKRLTGDIVFLAVSLVLLRHQGQLGIIIPDTILTSKYFEPVREDLLTQEIVSIIELPIGAFKGTEAKAHILVLRKGIGQSGLVKICRADVTGTVDGAIEIAPLKLVKRMDYSFWSQSHRVEIGGRTLFDVGAKIERGKYSAKELRKLGLPFFHTNDFPLSGSLSVDTYSYSRSVPTAEVGDILLSRVGSRCLGYVCIVRKGKIQISDCVFKISVPRQYQEELFIALRSEYGQAWLRALSHGVCAKVISKQDLFDFVFDPIGLPISE